MVPDPEEILRPSFSRRALGSSVHLNRAELLNLALRSVVSPNIITKAIRILFTGGTNLNQKSSYDVNLLTAESCAYSTGFQNQIYEVSLS